MTTDYLQVNQPDILEVIANLSNDEVFTPPRVVNAVLDLLPPEVWTDPALRWLDPGCKTGVFPREITKRLMAGLQDAIPDEIDRLAHIFNNMVFAIAITEITAMMARRTLYCSKDASSEFSAATFPTLSGRVWHERVEHSFMKGRCSECGGTREQLEKTGRDNHAYAFIHQFGRDEVEKEMGMKFDVIVGNPPYQMDGGAGGTASSPLYNIFVEQAIALDPRYISMIIPSRWMAGGAGLDAFRKQMLSDRRIRKIVDFAKMDTLFPGVDFEGGIGYFLWDRDNPGLCQHTFQQGGFISKPIERQLDEFDIFIRDDRALPILRKVLAKHEASFSDLASTRDPFGPRLGSSFKGYRKGERQPGDIKLFMNEGGHRVEKWIDSDLVTRNHSVVKKWKLFIPKAYGERGAIPARVLGPTIVAGPGSAATITYLFIGPFDTKVECENVDAYLRTRFARFLVSLRKITQDTTSSRFTWLPIQTWDRAWTDTELYRRYGITKVEQAFIETMIKDLPA
jgi:site-specific DNA-methyltransferase (adenine-specific)